MTINKKEDTDLESNNPLLRKIAQLKLSAAKYIEEAEAEGPLKL